MSMNTDQKIIKNKVGLLNLADMLGSVSEACKVMGYSRDSFYRFKELYEKGGELALKEISRRKPCLKNRTEPHIEQAIVELAIEQPAFGQVRIANELTKRGLFASPSGVRSVWLRHDLQTFGQKAEGARSETIARARPRADGIASSGHGEGEAGERGSWRDRDGASGLSGSAGHVLCRHDQEYRQDLSTDLYRHLYESCFCQALRSQKCTGGSRHAE